MEDSDREVILKHKNDFVSVVCDSCDTWVGDFHAYYLRGIYYFLCGECFDKEDDEL